MPIARCRGYLARISAGLRFGAVELVDSNSTEGVSGSSAIGSLREGWHGSGEYARNGVSPMRRKPFWVRKEDK